MFLFLFFCKIFEGLFLIDDCSFVALIHISLHSNDLCIAVCVCVWVCFLSVLYFCVLWSV